MLNTTTHETPAVFISGDKDGRRIEFAADAAASAALARLMAQNRSIRLPLPADPDAALPRPFAFLQLICADASGGLLSVGISDSGDTICLTGDAAYAKLIAALEYFSTAAHRRATISILMPPHATACSTPPPRHWYSSACRAALRPSENSRQNR